MSYQFRSFDYRYFADVNGTTTQLIGNIQPMDNAEYARRFPGVAGRRYDSFSMMIGYSADDPRNPLPLTRSIKYKKHASGHDCDPRCTGARGRTMNCECSCGGKNHGKMF